MKNLFIILLVAFVSCSEEEIESIQCTKAKAAVVVAEKAVDNYKAAGGKDWAVLADLRKEIKRLEEYKNITCGTTK